MSERINELQINSKNKDIRDTYGAINEFKKGYQCSNLAVILYWMRSVISLQAHSVLSGWKNNFC